MTRRRRWWLTGQQDEAQPSGADTRETADVLLQVVLPIVLILTYCVLQSARNYIEMVDEMRENYRQALIELQKQRIITALETVKNQRSQELGLAFLSQREIRFAASGKLISDHLALRKACRMTSQIFGPEGSRAREKAQVYERVLKVAKLTDAISFAPDAPVTAQIERAERGQITDANRIFLEKEIETFLNDLHQEVLQLELRVMQTALEIYRNAPLDVLYQWNPQLVAFKKAIVQTASDGGDPEPQEEALLRTLFRKLRMDFENQGYIFLPEIWETL